VGFSAGSGYFMTLREVAAELSRRLLKIFACGADRRRPFNGGVALFGEEAHFRDRFLRFEARLAAGRLLCS
jgi:hypothetical protein